MPQASLLERLASRTLPALTSILLVYVASRAALIATTVSPARDGARYFSYARELGERPLGEVAPEQEDHPGYPLAVRAALLAGETAGLTSRAAQVRLAQTATALCGLVLVVLAYFLARRVWGPVIAWAGLMAFVLLPRPAWQTADILSDPLYGVFFLAAALLFIEGIRPADDPGRPVRHRALRFLASGLCCSLAYWVRVDAVILLLAGLATLSLLALQSRTQRATARKVPLPSIVKGAISFVSAFAVGLVAFVAVYGRFSDKPVIEFLLGEGPSAGSVDAALAGAHPGLFATGGRLLASIGAVLSSACEETQYVHVALAGLGAVLAYREGARRPAGTFLAVVFAVTALALCAVDYRAGYVSSRYFLALSPLLACMTFYFLLTGGRLLREHAGVRSPLLTKPEILIAFGLCLSAAVSLPSLFGRRLHDDYHGAIAAARWVAERVGDGDTVYEPNFFPIYLAGLESRKTATVFPTARTGANHYLILRERVAEQHEMLRRLIAAGRAVKVKDFPRKPGGEKRDVHIYLLRGRRA